MSASLIEWRSVSIVGPGLLKWKSLDEGSVLSPLSEDTWKGRNVNNLLGGQQWNKIVYERALDVGNWVRAKPCLHLLTGAP